MKETLRDLVRALAQHHYSTDTILRAILLTSQADKPQEIANSLIEVINKTKTERELLDKIEEMEN